MWEAPGLEAKTQTCAFVPSQKTPLPELEGTLAINHPPSPSAGEKATLKKASNLPNVT